MFVVVLTKRFSGSMLSPRVYGPFESREEAEKARARIHFSAVTSGAHESIRTFVSKVDQEER